MPLKTYYKPKRSHPRTFKTCDAARIAAEVVKDGNGTEEEVMRCVALALKIDRVIVKVEHLTETKSFIKDIINKPGLGVGAFVAPGVDRAAPGFARSRLLTGLGILARAFATNPIFVQIGLGVLVLTLIDALVELVSEYDIINLTDIEVKKRNCKCKFLGDK